jgi:hypothetical protein
MIHYTVAWARSARDQLAAIWIEAPDRSAVTAAANEVDAVLTNDASTKGVELHEGLRVLFVSPLRVIFAVDDEDLLVEVLRVTKLE